MAKERSSKRASDLRKRAEKILAQDPQAIRSMATTDIQKLIHELNVYQIELEMQNEEFRRVQLELQESRDKYVDLYDFAPTGYFTLDHNSLIVDVNLASGELLGSEKARLIGTRFTSSISPDSQDAFYFHYREVLKTGIKGNCELKMLKADGTPFPAQLISMVIPEKDGNISQCRTAVIDITEHKLAEEALRRSEENFRHSLDSSPLGIRIVNTDGDEIYANQAMLDIYGYASIEELKATPVKKRYTPESYAEHQMRKEKRQRGEYAPSNYEVSIVRKDGAIHCFEVFRKEVLWNTHTQFQVLYNDITERKQMEEKIKQSEEKYRSLFTNMMNGFAYCKMLFDKDNQPVDFIYLEVNDAFEGLTGLRKADVTGKRVTEAVPGIKTSNPELITTYGEVALTGKPTSFEVYFKPLEKWLSILVYSPRKDYFVTIFENITEHKHAEERLRYQAKLLANITDAVIATDIQYNIQYWNQMAENQYGWTASEVIGHPLEMFITNDYLGNPLDSILQNISQVGYWKGEVTQNRRDGVRIPILITLSIIKDDTGQPAGFIAINRDITERKRMEQQLIMQDRLATIGQLTAGIAHEINNPLTSVIGFSELLLERDLPRDVKDDLNVIRDGATRTAEIVKNLLTFARRKPQEKILTDINENIRNTLALRSHEMQVNNIEIVTHLAANLPRVTGNLGQLQQVFLNIIVNAEFFMLEAHQKGTLTITTEQIGDFIRASFTDDGPGISEAGMKNLFTPFYTTKDVGKGTGLGLSICHGIITEHGGRIYTKSEPGKGATFIVELPVASATTLSEVEK